MPSTRRRPTRPTLRGALASLRAALATCALAGLCGLGGTALAAVDPPHDLELDLQAPAERWLPAVLPPGARLLHGPVELPFGAHARGQLVALHAPGPDGGLAVWYLAPMPDSGRVRIVRLREPRPADGFFDIGVTAAFAIGPHNASDLVLLHRFSRAAPSGGEAHAGGSVFRRAGAGAELLAAESRLLDGATDAAQARERLRALAAPLPPPHDTLARVFAALPETQVALTARERLALLRPGHPAHDVHDSANGYLHTRADASWPAYTVALFRHADGGWLVAVQRDGLAGSDTWFLRLQAADDAGLRAPAWPDVSAAVMPGYRRDAPYLLPRRGRSVSAGGLGRWTWDGRRFAPR